jgi:hypothetical protein
MRYTGLVGEIELLDRTQKRKACSAYRARDASLRTVSDLFRTEQLEESTIAHPFLLGAHGEITVQATDRRQMQTLEHGIDIIERHGRNHDATSRAAICTTYSAP